MTEHPGALVLSLDFELHWGVRDHVAATPEITRNLLASRSMVMTLADLFARREIRATWATVGLLFATNSHEAESFAPTLRPVYRRSELDPYREPLGRTEDEDPLHLAGSLVEFLARAQGQEVGSHTFSHYYCLERGADAGSFGADLAAAQKMAAEGGLRLRSLVLPRNQWRDDFAPALLENGFECFRGPQPGWAHRPRRGEDTTRAIRAARLSSTYAGPALPTFSWHELMEDSGLCNLPASAFLRPLSPRTAILSSRQDARLVRALRDAARRGRVLHLWWHPQNLVPDDEMNLERLNRLLDEVDDARRTEGLRSLSMSDANDLIRAERRVAA